MRMTTGPGPQSNVTDPSTGDRAATTAAEVQLAGVPRPTCAASASEGPPGAAASATVAASTRIVWAVIVLRDDGVGRGPGL